VTNYDERAARVINEEPVRLRVHLAAVNKARRTVVGDPEAQKRLARAVLDAPSRELITALGLAVASDVAIALDDDAQVQAELDQAWPVLALALRPDPPVA
jgi:hypothetical protein